MSPLEMVLAAITIIGAFIWTRGWLTRKFGFPENELWYELVSRPVLNARPDGLTVSFNETTVDNPYVATLHLWSTGTADIPTTAFDNNIPVTLRLDKVIIGEFVPKVPSGSTAEVVQVDTRTVEVQPGLIRKDYRASVEFITDGIASVEASHSLFGATLQSAAESERGAGERTATFGGLAVICLIGPMLLLALGFIVGIFIVEVRNFMFAWWFAFMAPTGLALGAIAAISTVPTRWDRAMRKRGTSRHAKFTGDAFGATARYHSS